MWFASRGLVRKLSPVSLSWTIIYLSEVEVVTGTGGV